MMEMILVVDDMYFNITVENNQRQIATLIQHTESNKTERN